MRAQTVDVKSSTGRILCCTVFRPGGKKLLAKGHIISDEDIRVLESEGMDRIWVTELEDGEISVRARCQKGFTSINTVIEAIRTHIP